VAEVTLDGQVLQEWFGRKGATFTHRFQWKTGATVALAVPVNLTGWVARLHFKAKANDAAVLLALTTENGGIVLSSDGWVDLLVTATQTKTLPNKAVFDLELESPTGYVRNIIGGTFTLGGNVTVEV
jgi:hypothetical protein